MVWRENKNSEWRECVQGHIYLHTIFKFFSWAFVFQLPCQAQRGALQPEALNTCFRPGTYKATRQPPAHCLTQSPCANKTSQQPPTQLGQRMRRRHSATSTLPNGVLLQRSPKPPRAPSCHLSVISSWHYHKRPTNSHIL